MALLTKPGNSIKNEGRHALTALANGQPRRSRLADLLPRKITHEGIILDQHIREGRFQRSLALITAFSSLLAGLEVTYEHYRGSYGQRIMYTPVILSFTLLVTSVWSVFNRWVARVLLPVTSLLLLIDGVVGFFYHIRGIHRKPGGWRIPIFNLIMGPPLFAPPLLGICGLLGLIASLLRREDDPRGASLLALPRSQSAFLGWLPRGLTREGILIEQDVREGRFQRALAAAAAISAFFSGIEALYSHYKNNFTYRVQWTPILLTPVVMIAGFGAVWSRTIARTLLPLASLLALDFSIIYGVCCGVLAVFVRTLCITFCMDRRCSHRFSLRPLAFLECSQVC
jgi:hypothetical protein